ncbi:MAG: BLUF domain-containing protein [Chitinophagales bacterium]|nr:BLUF domain-containing protein [Hyphomicrobiales bacterium]
MTVMQLIYASRPFGFDDLSLAGILASALPNNTRDGITGALICREDIYLQLLEGPHDTVKALFARIMRDDRHMDPLVLISCDSEERIFPKWAMRDDPARSWMWTRQQVSSGAIETASADEVRGVFVRLASELD